MVCWFTQFGQEDTYSLYGVRDCVQGRASKPAAPKEESLSQSWYYQEALNGRNSVDKGK
ncbi:hypothetical protein QG37_07196 [Candidozyma auris]|nr:hypothetical protein QG37_07196 [[Candida] auris]